MTTWFYQHRSILFFLMATFLFIILSMSLWQNGGRWLSSYGMEKISPKGYYRLVTRIHPIDEYGYVYLYNNQTNELLATSEEYMIADNSRVTWVSECQGKPSIDVGMNICFQITPEPAQPCCKAGQAMIPLQAKAIYIKN
ncbi:hypothetical protein HMY34_08345 [Thiothrix subterranea]|uniref:hypothetical protein n=1 Tax=Thiothrix subterranea TaxID=2735563 RepID=UPI00192B14F4|nr:hypothetical protein [Thiothrix subterranea]QQZ28763.1 hypothetical protein HMY34_08345 [Thiothrix subterranea]